VTLSSTWLRLEEGRAVSLLPPTAAWEVYGKSARPSAEASVTMAGIPVFAYHGSGLGGGAEAQCWSFRQDLWGGGMTTGDDPSPHFSPLPPGAG